MSGDWKSGTGDGSGDKGGTWDPDATRAWTPSQGKDPVGDQGWAGAMKDAAPGFAVDPRSAGQEGSFTETTTTSFGSRVKGALTGVLIGLALVPGSAYLLFWNEGRAVQTARSLTEGAGALTAADATRERCAQRGLRLSMAQVLHNGVQALADAPPSGAAPHPLPPALRGTGVLGF